MKRRNQNSGSEDNWSSIADMMAGLMIIFLFIAISYMARVGETPSKYVKLKSNIRNELLREFRNDLKKWNAELPDGSLTIRFKDPEILFDPLSAKLKPEFEKILLSFYPRYVAILSQNEFKNEIEAIQIEGHTSSEWLGKTSEAAYFHNLKLSQERTRRVAAFASRLGGVVKRNSKWLRNSMSAIGYSSSRPILDANGNENYNQSRRVEFSIKLKSDDKLSKMSILGS